MKIFTLPLAANTLGSDPTIHLYNALNATFPEYGLTKTNSVILKIQPSATDAYPNLTYLRIQKGYNEGDVYEFFYNRYNINSYLANPMFNAVEAAQAAALPTSVQLVSLLAGKTGLNFRSDDFWTSINSLDYSGGTVKPNWYMESMYDSVYWCGAKQIWLHT